MIGTFINVGAVLAGTTIGVVAGERLPERIRETVFHGLGLVTILVGIVNGLEAFGPELSSLSRASGIIVLGSVLLGGILGELLRIDRGLERFGEALRSRFAADEARFTEGFVVASLVFCVGPLTVLGSIQDGLTGSFELLGIKSLLDGFAAMAFASALGWGVGFAAVTVLVYQGALTLSASAVAGAFSPAVLAALTGVGGILILAVGLRLLELREIRVANLLPALVLAPVAISIVERMQ